MTPMLSFENVNVAIADAPVLRNVSFSLQPGVSAALIGRNGAGKTTTVRTIMGFTKALAEEKVTSVFVEHDMDMVERYANRVAVWNVGKIQKVGTPAEVLADPKVREQVIGI